jgi:hypothetical protein
VVGAEGHHLYRAGVRHETAYRVGHQSSANALTACMPGYHEPAHVVRRGFCAEEQTAEHVRPVSGRRDKGGTPADVLRERRPESWLTGHRPEPLLDLSRELDEARRVLLAGESDDHRTSCLAQSLRVNS